jgi:iron(III) transport system substrate-binding protein
MKHFNRSGGRTRAVAVALVAAVTLSGGLAACGADGSAAERPADEGGVKPELLDDAEWQEVLDAANEEGELLVYTSSGATEPAFALFEKAYPDIDITIERQPTADLVTRLDQELSVEAPGADVAFHSQEQWYSERGEDGLLAPLRLSPEVAEDFADLDTARYYIPVSRTPYTLAYNTKIGQPVKTIEELIDVAGDTPVGILDPASGVPTAYQVFKWSEVYGEDLVDRLTGLDLVVHSSGSTMSQSLAAGEIGYGINMSAGYIAPLKEESAPVDEVVFEEATVGPQYGPGVIATASHPNAAQVFVNWLMSPEGQGVLLEYQGGAVPTEVEGSLPWDAVEMSPWTPEDQQEWLEQTWNPAIGR